MKKIVMLILATSLLGACNNKSDEDSTLTKKLLKNQKDDTTKEEAEDDEGWSSSQKKKAYKRFLALAQKNDKRSPEEDIENASQCVVDKVESTLSYQDFWYIITFYEAEEEVKDPRLQKPATVLRKAMQECGKKYNMK